MEKSSKKQAYNLTLSAVFVALASVLSLIKVYNLPLGGSVTFLSMLPIVMLSCILGLKWGVGSAFVYSVIQLIMGIALDGVLGWGLTPACLIGTIVLDYLLAFTVLGFAGVFVKKGTVGICLGVVMAMVLRFLCHFVSGIIIFGSVCPWKRVALYSICYNGSFMLPELIVTVIGAVILFRLPQIKKLIEP